MKKTAKILFLISLTILLVLALAGCDGNKAPAETPTLVSLYLTENGELCAKCDGWDEPISVEYTTDGGQTWCYAHGTSFGDQVLMYFNGEEEKFLGTTSSFMPGDTLEIGIRAPETSAHAASEISNKLSVKLKVPQQGPFDLQAEQSLLGTDTIPAYDTYKNDTGHVIVYSERAGKFAVASYCYDNFTTDETWGDYCDKIMTADDAYAATLEYFFVDPAIAADTETREAAIKEAVAKGAAFTTLTTHFDLDETKAYDGSGRKIVTIAVRYKESDNALASPVQIIDITTYAVDYFISVTEGAQAPDGTRLDSSKEGDDYQINVTLCDESATVQDLRNYFVVYKNPNYCVYGGSSKIEEDVTLMLTKEALTAADVGQEYTATFLKNGAPLIRAKVVVTLEY